MLILPRYKILAMCFLISHAHYRVNICSVYDNSTLEAKKIPQLLRACNPTKMSMKLKLVTVY